MTHDLPEDRAAEFIALANAGQMRAVFCDALHEVFATPADAWDVDYGSHQSLQDNMHVTRVWPAARPEPEVSDATYTWDSANFNFLGFLRRVGTTRLHQFDYDDSLNCFTLRWDHIGKGAPLLHQLKLVIYLEPITPEQLAAMGPELVLTTEEIIDGMNAEDEGLCGGYADFEDDEADEELLDELFGDDEE